jgi:hypothetical protein
LRRLFPREKGRKRKPRKKPFSPWLGEKPLLSIAPS